MSNGDLHKLIKRQLKRRRIAIDDLPDSVQALLADVSAAYTGYDDDREMLERAMELANDDFLAAKAEVDEANNSLERRVKERTEELRLALEKAKTASRAKSAFVANVSHETRTPLVGIIGFAEALVTDDLPVGEMRDLAEVILNNGKHLLELLNDVLELSRMESGKLTVTRRPVGLDPLVQDIESVIRMRAQDSGLRFRLNKHYPLPRRFLSDLTKVKQVLLNLLSNAIKFTKHGSVELDIRFDAAAELLSFSVTDTGMGMSKQAQDELFTAFHQAGSFVQKEFGGTGLGLHISRMLCEALGGDITVVSAPGQGSTFTASFATGPVNPTTVESNNRLNRERKREARKTATPSLNGHVLVAEDAPENQKLIAYLLRQVGVTYTIVGNGQLAVEAAAQETFDLVIMDMQMPVLDGYAATRQLREGGATLPVIAVSAHAFDKHQDACITAGCTDFLEKPFSRESFFAMLAVYLPRLEGGRPREFGEIQA